MTPEEFAELSGAYPDAPNNPTPSTTGFMDNGGFAWAGGNAESYESEWVVEAVQQNLNDKDFVDYAYSKIVGGNAKGHNAKSMAIAEVMSQNSNNKDFTTFVETEVFNAEIEDVSDSMAVITNKFDDMVGVVEVDDDADDDELVEVSIQDENMNEIASYTLDDGVLDEHLYSMMAEGDNRGDWPEEAKKYFSKRERDEFDEYRIGPIYKINGEWSWCNRGTGSAGHLGSDDFPLCGYCGKSFNAESAFDRLEDEVAEEYEEKGMSDEEAERIGAAVAYKQGVKKYGKKIMTEAAKKGVSAKSLVKNTEEPIVEYPDWIPAGDGRALGQQNSAINMSPLHAEGENWIDEECVECGEKMYSRVITTVDFMGGVGCNACGGGVCESCDENTLHDCFGVETFEAGFLRKNYPEREPEPSIPLPGTPEAYRIKAMPDKKKAATDGLSLEVKIWNGMEEQDDLGTVEGRIIIPLSHTEFWGQFWNDESWDEHAKERIKDGSFEIFIDGKWVNAITWAENNLDHEEAGFDIWNNDLKTGSWADAYIDESLLGADTIGTPSPTFNEGITGQDGPETEPTNSNFSAESGISWGKLFIGSAALILGGGLLANKQGWVGNADDDIEPIEDIPPPSDAADTLVENPDTGDLQTGDYEEMVVQSTGYAVPVIPMSLDGSFMGSRFQALPTDRYVDYNEPGIGAHTDIAMERNTKYLTPAADLVRMDSEDCGCTFFQKIKAFFTGESCDCDEETDVKESQGVGQSPYFQMGKEPVDMNYRVIKEVSPKGLDPASVRYMPTDWVGQTGQAYVPDSLYGTMYDLGVAGIHPSFNTPNESSTGANRMGDRMAQPDTLSNVIGASLSVGTNASYTDGGETKTLAQWGIENQVSQISDSEAVVVSHTSGVRKMIRRV